MLECWQLCCYLKKGNSPWLTWHEADQRDAVLAVELRLCSQSRPLQHHVHPEVHQALCVVHHHTSIKRMESCMHAINLLANPLKGDRKLPRKQFQYY